MADFQFLHPNWLFAAIPALLLTIWLFVKPKTSSLIANHLSQQLGLDEKKSHRSLASMVLIGWLISVLALAGPSFQKQSVPGFGVNNARVIVMDMTLSMYATDITPNRLTQARYKVLDLLPALNEGTTGLVAYSADGYMVSPLTSDSKTLANLIPNLSPAIMPTHGSNAAAGVKKAINMLTQAGHLQGDIILISDDMSSEESKNIEQLLKGTDWRLSVMSVGTRQGAPIKLPSGDMLTNNGTTVVAKTNIKALQALATIGNGIYTPLRTDDGDIQALVQTLQHVQLKSSKDNQGSPELEVHINNGFWLLPILLLLALSGFRRGGIFSIALLLTLPLLTPRPALASTTIAPLPSTKSSIIDSVFKTADQQGFNAYQNKAYSQAASKFENKAWQGAAQYQAGNYQAAIEALQGLNDENSRYNLASSFAQSGQLEAAKRVYEDILKQNPNNQDAKKNLDIVNKALEQQKQQNQKDKDKRKDQDKNQNNQQDSKQEKKQQDQSSSDQSKKDQSKSEQNKQDQSQSNSDQSNSEQKKSESNNSSAQNNKSSQQKESKPDQSKQSQDSKSEQKKNQEKDKQQQPNQTQQQAQTDKNKPQALTQTTPKQGEKPSSTVAVDPQLKKLEQIPDDVRRLLQAQMALEAQQNPAPQSTGQTW
ncbi:VWA domain-containing protein [Vibrio sp. S17_S38]|uniref:vWA domain-containing protein n=1 Tax=Vibrio sp. S17_S38 TaxID=2720229 RepID=UPI0016807219|nr:VWA domain-containing protein [Vibrio sp. S17_S38]MBD1573564.1 VWA domain-containing protein [Vibrio sp. S17_S38]